MTNEPDNSTNPPAWASILLERFGQLEARFSSASFLSDDPNVVIRTPGFEFTPPLICQCRRYLFECPKNTLRQYDPPKLNAVQLNQQAKLMDTQLYLLYNGNNDLGKGRNKD
ncbi:hypothetical protein G6F46_012661 [Rhizopus delemar]|uniref:Uncharacterized protein n=2 Tax=Rhizopus TaxID=4842 RepID=A0A9P7CI68_9FUNG|nr:hypothetical protein G6F55_012609 [Rhizopus delemar]KAG1537620.1 hypothetical protein G6F51_010259 [Rhizopus arrhizus]KAG1485773.1 hypothetical protein G6F54_013327 [Rhizopus delemar]KAG1494186.1 hypothetical protein G6F53_012616 [Rhizopus delemar]KAG1503999.1 hypothetical protein G6F52_012225 [Rhizopus delemar]